MMVHARTVTAAIAIGILGLAGAGAMPGSADNGSDKFEERWGDLNCSGAVQSVDALYVLRYVGGPLVYIPEGICWDSRMGMFPDTLLQIAGGPQVQWADVDCNGKISSVDALWLLRNVAGLSVPGSKVCPTIGAWTTLSHVYPQPGAASQQAAWELPWGDVNCNMAVNAIDGLKVLRYVAGIRIYTQEGGCLFPDTQVQIHNGPRVQWADADCDGKITSVDALRLLRYFAGYQVVPLAGCPDPGATVTIQ